MYLQELSACKAASLIKLVFKHPGFHLYSWFLSVHV